MKNFIYHLLMKLADKLRPASETVNIKSIEHLDELIEKGFKINKLNIEVNNPPVELSPLDMTIRQLAKQAIGSNAVTLRGAITLADREEPEILYYILLTEDLVKKINPLLEKFEEENL